MMGPTSAIVLFAVIWFMVFFIVLPLRMKTQGEVGEVVPGTHASAPADPQLKKKAIITTAVAVVLWCLITWVIFSRVISLRDLDLLGVMPPEATSTN